MDELVRWLGEQLDEDERIARAAPPGPWIGTDAEDVSAWSVYDQEWLIASATVYTHDKPMGGKRGPGYIDAAATTAHIAVHDPARVLREIEAKRAVVARYEFACGQAADDRSNSEEEREVWVQVAGALQSVVILLAAPYSDRPGFKAEEWAP